MYWLMMLSTLLIGVGLWTLAEWIIHGKLVHLMKTPATTLHMTHHKNPKLVFTPWLIWIPIAVGVYGLSMVFLGVWIGGVFSTGFVGGFLRYEYLHWRIHFKEPRSRREQRRKAHHLAHHYVDAASYHGVTTAFWDRVFRTLPDDFEAAYEQVGNRPPMEGPTNLGRLWGGPAEKV